VLIAMASLQIMLQADRIIIITIIIIIIIIIMINKDITIEIQRMWNLKTHVIPVITGATGTISKSFKKYLSNVPGIHEAKELQKTGTLGTKHTVRKVLM
jgi:hypothetical protein